MPAQSYAQLPARQKFPHGRASRQIQESVETNCWQISHSVRPSVHNAMDGFKRMHAWCVAVQMRIVKEIMIKVRF